MQHGAGFGDSMANRQVWSLPSRNSQSGEGARETNRQAGQVAEVLRKHKKEVPHLQKASSWERHTDAEIRRLSGTYLGVGEGGDEEGVPKHRQKTASKKEAVAFEWWTLTAKWDLSINKWYLSTPARFSGSHPTRLMVFSPPDGTPLPAPLFSQCFLFRASAAFLPWRYSMY